MYELNEETIQIIEKAKKEYKQECVSIISQQCIGGVIYHDMGMQFLSPTINLYFEAKDFIKFIYNLNYYTNLQIKMSSEDGKVIGFLGDIKIMFLHYKTEEEAKSKWDKRKNRIIWDKIFIICTDRDGFDDECFEKFKQINYPKVLITGNEKWSNEDFVIYLEQYCENGTILDTIPKREFYKENKIIRLINEI